MRNWARAWAPWPGACWAARCSAPRWAPWAAPRPVRWSATRWAATATAQAAAADPAATLIQRVPPAPAFVAGDASWSRFRGSFFLRAPAPHTPFPQPASGGCEPLELPRSEEHTSELQSRLHLVCRLLLEKKNTLVASPDRTPIHLTTHL